MEARLIALAAWMRETYGSTMIQALKTVLPVKEKKQPRAERRILLQADPRQAEAWLALFQKKHNTARERPAAKTDGNAGTGLPGSGRHLKGYSGSDPFHGGAGDPPGGTEDRRRNRRRGGLPGGSAAGRDPDGRAAGSPGGYPSGMGGKRQALPDPWESPAAGKHWSIWN